MARRGPTRHGRAVCGVPAASPRPAASDAGAPALGPCPCIPARPPEGVYKVNFDASLFENVGCAGIGLAIRDLEGEIIAVLSQRIPLPFSVEMAEAMAA